MAQPRGALTKASTSVLRALADVRALTPSLGALLLGVSRASAARSLKRLERDGHLDSYQLVAHQPESSLLLRYKWVPGDAAPDCHGLAYRARARFKNATPRLLTLFGLSPSGARALGFAPIRKLRVGEATHDLLMAFWRAENDSRIRSWVPEDSICPGDWSGTQPDALVELEAAAGATSRIVLEAVGSYSAAKFAECHATISANLQPNYSAYVFI